MSKSSVEHGPDRRLEMVGAYDAPQPAAPEPTPDDELRRAERLVLEGERAGLDDLEMGMRLGDLVRICFARQAWAEAVPPLTRLLALNRAQGEDRPEVATVLSSLATARYALGEHNEAAQLWEEALAIRERWLVPNHFMIARSLENVAEARVAQGRMDEAMALLRRALSIWQQTLPPSDPTVRAIRTRIGDLQLLASEELPGRGPVAPRPASTSSPLPSAVRFGSYSREPMGVHGVQLGLESGAPAADAPTAPRVDGAHTTSADPPPAVRPVALAPVAVVPAPPADASPRRSSGEARVTAEPASAAVVAPLFVEPHVARPTLAPSAATVSSPYLVDLDAPAPEPALVAAPVVDEPEERTSVVRNWLQLGRALAVSAPESSLEFPADLDPEVRPTLAERARRVPRAAGATGLVVLIAIVAAYRLAGSAAPATAEVSGVARPAGVQPSGGAVLPPNANIVRQTSAGTVVAPSERRAVSASPARVVPDETETVARAAAAARTKSDVAPARDSRPSVSETAALKSMPAAAAAQLADAMKAVESTTVVGSDSAVRQMLYGRALALSTDGDAARGRSGAAVPSSAKAASEEVRDMKPAMLAPGGTQPIFPFQLLSENVTGTVVIEVLVDATGHADARRARIVHSDHPLFTAAVLRALPTMRFVPAEAHGQKVAQMLQVPFRFDRQAARP